MATQEVNCRDCGGWIKTVQVAQNAPPVSLDSHFPYLEGCIRQLREEIATLKKES